MASPPRKRGHDPLIGRTIAGRYEILQRVGAGGMGVVYKAHQAAMDRFVALKVLSKGLAANDHNIKRFHQEARAASRLRHPNTITLHDFGQTEDDVLYIAMEFLDGISLESAIGQGGLEPARAIKIMAQVCRSLEEAHKAGIIHRDLKPENIFLNEIGGETDFVKVLDFGVAKLREGKKDSGTLTQAGMIFGTPKYMSPEQAQSLPLDPRSDLYSMGVMLYEMLVGHPPFDAESPLSILIKHVHEAPPPIRTPPGAEPLPEPLRATVMRLLEKDRAKRPASAQDLLAELTEAAQLLSPTDRLTRHSTGFMAIADVGAFASAARPPRDVPTPPAAPVDGGTVPDPESAIDTVPEHAGVSEQWAIELQEAAPSRGMASGSKGPPILAVGVASLLVVGAGVAWLVTQKPGPTAAPVTATATAAQPDSEAKPPAGDDPAPTEAPADGPEGDAADEAKPAGAETRPDDVPEGAATGPAKPTSRSAARATRKPSAKPAAKPRAPAASKRGGKVTLVLKSRPLGVNVYTAGGTFVGLTPVTLTRPRGTKAEKFTFKKKGYVSTTALALLSQDRQIMTRLEKEEVEDEDEPRSPRRLKLRTKPGFERFGDFRSAPDLE